MTISYLSKIHSPSGVTLACSGERNTVEYNLELAAGFNFYLGAFFRLKVSLSSLEASSGVEGSFGFSGYALIEASVSRSYEPKPKQIYKYEKDQTYFIGPVPVIVTYRAQVDAFFQASATLEGTLFYGFGRSWEYDLTFSYVKGRSPKEFMSTESLVEVDAGVPDPVLEARLGVSDHTCRFQIVAKHRCRDSSKQSSVLRLRQLLHYIRLSRALWPLTLGPWPRSKLEPILTPFW